MKERERLRINENWQYIVQNVCFDDIRDLVISKNLFSDEANERISEKATNSDKVNMFKRISTCLSYEYSVLTFFLFLSLIICSLLNSRCENC